MVLSSLAIHYRQGLAFRSHKLVLSSVCIIVFLLGNIFKNNDWCLIVLAYELIDHLCFMKYGLGSCLISKTYIYSCCV